MRDAVERLWWRFVEGPLLRVGGEALYRLLGPGLGGRPPLYEEVVPGQLSRSAQPDASAYRWLRQQGVRSIVNLRLERDDLALLRQLRFSHYLHAPIPEGLPPTDDEAEALLEFIAEPAHWPVHVHCLTGIQRTGTVVALVRYAVHGWSMDRALREARAYRPGPTRAQIAWLRAWAATHPRGDHAPDRRDGPGHAGPRPPYT